MLILCGRWTIPGLDTGRYSSLPEKTLQICSSHETFYIFHLFMQLDPCMSDSVIDEFRNLDSNRVVVPARQAIRWVIGIVRQVIENDPFVVSQPANKYSRNF